jgi:hypothetical protein
MLRQLHNQRKVYDPSFETPKSMIEDGGCKVLEIEYEDAEEEIEMIFPFKSLYNALKRKSAIPAIFEPLSQDTIDTMCEVLNIEDFDQDWLNTIIMCDDCGNSGLFKNPNSFLNTHLKLCRDDNVIYFLTIHGIGQLSASIRQNTAVVYVFRGLSNERLVHVWRQCNTPISWDEFKYRYQSLQGGERVLVIDNLTAQTHSE